MGRCGRHITAASNGSHGHGYRIYLRRKSERNPCFWGQDLQDQDPDDAKLTFGPWSPPPRGATRTGGFEYSESARAGTLRVYGKTQKDILACFAGVRGFRDLTLEYAEEVAREEGAVIWKDDETGYSREEKLKRSKDWVDHPQLPPASRKRRK